MEGCTWIKAGEAQKTSPRKFLSWQRSRDQITHPHVLRQNSTLFRCWETQASRLATHWTLEPQMFLLTDNPGVMWPAGKTTPFPKSTSQYPPTNHEVKPCDEVPRVIFHPDLLSFDRLSNTSFTSDTGRWSPSYTIRPLVILEGLKKKRRFQVQAQQTRLNTISKLTSFLKKNWYSYESAWLGGMHATAGMKVRGQRHGNDSLSTFITC